MDTKETFDRNSSSASVKEKSTSIDHIEQAHIHDPQFVKRTMWVGCPACHTSGLTCSLSALKVAKLTIVWFLFWLHCTPSLSLVSVKLWPTEALSDWTSVTRSHKFGSHSRCGSRRRSWPKRRSTVLHHQCDFLCSIHYIWYSGSLDRLQSPLMSFLELPANIYIRKIGVRPFLATIAFLWGSLTLASGFVKTWRQLVAARALLGMLEAGYFPACTYLISIWYTRREVQTRLAFFYIL